MESEESLPVAPYCGFCRGTLRAVTLSDKKRWMCQQCGRRIYPSSPVSVSVVVYDDEGYQAKIALVRRATQPGFGRWVVPGGYCELGEDPADAACRETKEELGIRIERPTLMGIFLDSGSPVITIGYTARTFEPRPLLIGPECLEAKWVKPSEIPWQSIHFSSTRALLQKAREFGRESF